MEHVKSCHAEAYITFDPNLEPKTEYTCEVDDEASSSMLDKNIAADSTTFNVPEWLLEPTQIVDPTNGNLIAAFPYELCVFHDSRSISVISDIPDVPTSHETIQNQYEIIRQSVEDALPNSTVHIYGSCLYLKNPKNKPTEIDLHVEFGKFPMICRIYLENGIWLTSMPIQQSQCRHIETS